MKAVSISISAFLLVLLLLANFGFTASASGATLQVTGYSIAPSKVYPGSRGYIQLAIANSGTDTASGIRMDYSDSYTYRMLSVYASDIGSGANSQVSIPFEIPPELSTGMILYKIDVYYLATTSGGSARSTTFSVPIVVSQDEILQVDTLSAGTRSLSPGEKILIELEIRNTGGTINDLSVYAPQNSSFSIDGSTREYVGSIESNSSKRISLNLLSSSLAPVGQYLIPLNFTYTDALQNPSSQTLYVGPVNVLEPSTQFKVILEPLSSTEIGSAADFDMVLENDGTGAMSAAVNVGSTDTFTPLGTSKFYFSSIEPGKTASETVTLGISASASSGYYELPLNITLGTGRTFTQTVGIQVEATPEIKITGELSTSTTGNEIVIQISNTGNTPIRSVYAVVDMGGTRTEKFIGTMAIDDYSTISVSTSSSGAGSSNGSLPQNGAAGGPVAGNLNGSSTQQFNRTQASSTAKVTVTFKDEQNQPHTVTQDVKINSAGAGQASFFSRTTRSNGIIFGLDAVQLGGIVVVIAAIAYFLYRRRKKKHAHIAEK